MRKGCVMPINPWKENGIKCYNKYSRGYVVPNLPSGSYNGSGTDHC